MLVLTEDRDRELRRQFPSLSRSHQGKSVIYLDGPAGTQVPVQVADAVRDAMLHHNANRSGKFATSREVDALVLETQIAAADWVGASDPAEIVFGPNMTTLTFHFSRCLSRQWKTGDEILVTNLDHDANFTPWMLAARDQGVTVRVVDINTTDATLCLDDFRRKLSDRTRLVAFTAASNSVGSLTPVPEITRLAHQAGALVYVDAVHYAPHGLIDVKTWDCDFLICSAYKFFGPHIGILWGRRELLESVEAYKLRPAPDTIPGKWMTGTQNHSCLAGVTQAIHYVSNIVDHRNESLLLRQRLISSFAALSEYEHHLIMNLIRGLQAIPKVKIYGITDPERVHNRVPTIAITVDGKSSAEVAIILDNHGIYAWHGNYYAQSLSERLEREPEGMVRMGLMHYNTAEEVARTIEAVKLMLGHN